MPNVQSDHQSLFERIYTFAPIGIALVSIEGAFLNVNPALCSILGYSGNELASMTYQEITHPDDLKAENPKTRKLLDGAMTSYEMEKRYFHKNGSAVWASLHTSLVRDEQSGAPLYFISHIIDISERKAAEKIDMLISENAQEIIYCTNSDGICYYCSPSIERLLGYAPKEIVGKTNIEHIHPDDLEKLKKLTPSETMVLQYRCRHKEGHYLWFETTFRLIDDESGEKKVLAIGRDITERKKNEDILAEAQRIASIGSWEWDIAANTVALSDQVYHICGIERPDHVHTPQDIINFVYPGDQELFKSQFEEAARRQSLNFEFRIQQPDGIVRYLNIRGVISSDENGEPVSMNGTIQDITDRKKVELKLLETVERYTSLKKYNHDAILSLDLEGNIIHGNAMAEQMTGYSISELTGTSVSKFIGSVHLAKVLSESMNDASIQNDIDTIMHRDGHLIEVLTTIAPIIISNENVGFYIIAKDITDQKKLMIEKESAENTNKAKSEFLAMMSHELRTPMNGVIGMTDLLSETTSLDSEQKQFVSIIRKSGETMLAIINEILDFSKVDSGKTILEEHSFRIPDCIRETIDVFAASVKEKRLDMTWTVAPEVPATVIGDPDRLKQVLMNIVGNAVKFTARGGVAISVRPVRQTPATVLLEIAVKDTGIGIPPDKINHLFEPFHQLDNFMTRNYEGTGLGLAISKKLVELMGGTIRVEPSEGAGATFIFTVSLKQAGRQNDNADKTEHVSDSRDADKTLNILVAEDNEINQLVLKRMLQKQGHTVTVAEDGNEVCQKARAAAYDLIFMDVQMPVMNGLEAAKIIRQSLPPDQCPVIIAVTANALEGDREKCLAAGMDEYISKPIKIDVLADIISRFFSDAGTPAKRN